MNTTPPGTNPVTDWEFYLLTHPDVVTTAKKGPSVGERAHVLSEKARVNPFVSACATPCST